ncbi:FkbM family methyltransferase [Jatrophihabitans sp. YIM 134969]
MTATADPVHLVPPRLRSLARRSLNRVGLDVSRNPYSYRLGQVLERAGVTTVVDIGANEGQFARALRVNGYAGDILSIEPLQDAHTQLARHAASDPRWAVVRAAVSDTDGSVSVNVAANSYSSSVLPMTAAHLDADPQSAYRTSEEVEAFTLDTLVTDRGLDPARCAFKIDVQGYESAVLDGSSATLATAAVVQVEMSLVELYEGQTLMPQIVERLTAAGMTLWLLEPGFSDRTSGRLLQCDGVFVRAADHATT